MKFLLAQLKRTNPELKCTIQLKNVAYVKTSGTESYPRNDEVTLVLSDIIIHDDCVGIKMNDIGRLRIIPYDSILSIDVNGIQNMEGLK